MEILSDILRSIRVEGSVYFCDHVKAPWTKDFKGSQEASFHLLRRGACWAQIGDRVERLGAGDLIFLGPGIDHRLSSRLPGSEGQSVEEDAMLLCGHCGFSDNIVTSRFSIFPEFTIVRDEDFIRYPWLKSTFDQISAEYLSQGPGSELIVNKLTEVILVELVRINFASSQANPFLESLKDKRISKSLQLIHEKPHYNWTLEQIADAVGMSRAAFSKRFKDLVGQPMFGYLTSLRISKAQELLRDTKLPVHEIAIKSGYESERAFTNTFKKMSGVTPKQFRAQ